MIGGGGAAWATWVAYLLLLAIIKLVLTMLSIHTCRGNIFNTKRGRRSALLQVAFTASDTAGVLTVAVTLVNTYLSPHVRFLRWFAGILTAARRNSQATGSRVTDAAPTAYPSQVRRHRYLGLFGHMLHGLLRKRRECLRAVRLLNGLAGLRRESDGRRCAKDGRRPQSAASEQSISVFGPGLHELSRQRVEHDPHLRPLRHGRCSNELFCFTHY